MKDSLGIVLCLIPIALLIGYIIWLHGIKPRLAPKAPAEPDASRRDSTVQHIPLRRRTKYERRLEQLRQERAQRDTPDTPSSAA